MTNKQQPSWINRLLHRFGLVESKYLNGRKGEYKNVFCPHCGEFIPNNYTVLAEAPVESEGMAFDCPNCSRSGAVLNVEKYEPLIDHRRAKIGKALEEESDDDE